MSVPDGLIPTRLTQLPEYGGTDDSGYTFYVLGGVTYKVQFGNLVSASQVPTTRTITAGTGLTGGGDLSANRTIAVAAGGIGTTQLAVSGVTAGSYGSATASPVITVDATGRVTSASSVAITPTGYVPDTRT